MIRVKNFPILNFYPRNASWCLIQRTKKQIFLGLEFSSHFIEFFWTVWKFPRRCGNLGPFEKPRRSHNQFFRSVRKNDLDENYTRAEHDDNDVGLLVRIRYLGDVTKDALPRYESLIVYTSISVGSDMDQTKSSSSRTSGVGCQGGEFVGGL